MSLIAWVHRPDHSDFDQRLCVCITRVSPLGSHGDYGSHLCGIRPGLPRRPNSGMIQFFRILCRIDYCLFVHCVMCGVWTLCVLCHFLVCVCVCVGADVSVLFVFANSLPHAIAWHGMACHVMSHTSKQLVFA